MSTGKTVSQAIDELVLQIGTDERSLAEKKSMVNTLRKSIGLLPLFPETPQIPSGFLASGIPAPSRAAAASSGPPDWLNIEELGFAIAKQMGRKNPLSTWTTRQCIEAHDSSPGAVRVDRVEGLGPAGRLTRYSAKDVSVLAAEYGMRVSQRGHKDKESPKAKGPNFRNRIFEFGDTMISKINELVSAGHSAQAILNWLRDNYRGGVAMPTRKTVGAYVNWRRSSRGQAQEAASSPTAAPAKKIYSPRWLDLSQLGRALAKEIRRKKTLAVPTVKEIVLRHDTAPGLATIPTKTGPRKKKLYPPDCVPMLAKEYKEFRDMVDNIQSEKKKKEFAEGKLTGLKFGRKKSEKAAV